MLRKLLKYDMKAIAKFWWIIAVVTLGAAILGGVGFRILMEATMASTDDPFVAFLILGGALFFLLSIVVLSSSFLLTEVLIFWRFYKNFFTDEGYLTFTLPVNRRQLLLSKTINALIWSVLHIVVLFIGMLIMLLIAPPSTNGSLIDPSIVGTITVSLSTLFSGLGAWTVLYVIELIILVFFYFLFFVTLIHMCITIGSIIAKKLKLLASIGIFYGINMVISFAGQLLIYLFQFLITYATDSLLSGASENMGYLVGAIFILLVCAICATLAFTVYCITQRLLDRKLNLT